MLLRIAVLISLEPSNREAIIEILLRIWNEETASQILSKAITKKSGSKKSRKFGQKSKGNHLRKVDVRKLIYLKKYKHCDF
uniref:Transposase n=1 Tax=Heterorhabditis bacteriophora TaxID=37862 RepID=A0A1I7W8J2_HETBA